MEPPLPRASGGPPPRAPATPSRQLQEPYDRPKRCCRRRRRRPGRPVDQLAPDPRRRRSRGARGADRRPRVGRQPVGQLHPRHPQLALPAARLRLRRRRPGRLHDPRPGCRVARRLRADVRPAGTRARQGHRAHRTGRRRLRPRPSPARTARRSGRPTTVVVATGGYHIPVVPPWAAAIDPSVTQLQSAHYKNAAQLPDGAVLVVGSGQSGAQIAEDLHLEGRQVHLALGNAPRVARFYRGRDCMTWLADMGLYDTPVAAVPRRAGGAGEDQPLRHRPRRRARHRPAPVRRRRHAALRRARRRPRRARSPSVPPSPRSLDNADSVYNSICGDIDRYIEREGIDAPAGRHVRARLGARARPGGAGPGRRRASPRSSGRSATAPTTAG